LAVLANFLTKTLAMSVQDGITLAVMTSGRAFMTDSIALAACRDFDRILVKTRHSVYELIVLSGERGDVMLRGGVFGEEFQRGRVTGSTLGGSAVQLRAIRVGRFLELNVGGKTFVTSSVQTALHQRPDADAA
jgi:hypothetical protein